MQAKKWRKVWLTNPAKMLSWNSNLRNYQETGSRYGGSTNYPGKGDTKRKTYPGEGGHRPLRHLSQIPHNKAGGKINELRPRTGRPGVCNVNKKIKKKKRCPFAFFRETKS